MVFGKHCYKQIHVFHSEHCRIGVQVSSVLRDSSTQSSWRLCIALGGRLLCDQASLHGLAILECRIGRPLYYWKKCCDFHARARILGNTVISRFPECLYKNRTDLCLIFCGMLRGMQHRLYRRWNKDVRISITRTLSANG